MTTKRKISGFGLRTLAIAAVAAAGLARAQVQESKAPTARILETQVVAGTGQEMVLREVTIAPGGAVPMHHHTVPGLVFIVEGEAESAYGSDAPRRYRAGETLQDIAEVPHTVFRNADQNRPLRFLTFYAAPHGQPYLVTP